MDPASALPYAIPVFFGFGIFICAEMALWRRGGGVRYETRDAAASTLMGVGYLVAGALLGGVSAGAFVLVHRHALLEIGYSGWAFAACFLLEDLAYYWFHRTSHRRRWFWAHHVVHHSSQHYNLTTALRQGWTGPVAMTFLFWLPLVWIGFEPAMVTLFMGISLVYQFWIHTEAIGRLGPLEWVFNTPSHHRVHHASNPQYLDANYGAVLIIWDRLFGTFVPEETAEPPRYGLVKNIATFNPFRIAFHEWAAMIKDVLRARSAREALGYVLGPPGWSPDGSRKTSDQIKTEWRRRTHSKQSGAEPRFRKAPAGVVQRRHAADRTAHRARAL